MYMPLGELALTAYRDTPKIPFRSNGSRLGPFSFVVYMLNRLMEQKVTKAPGQGVVRLRSQAVWQSRHAVRRSDSCEGPSYSYSDVLLLSPQTLKPSQP